MVKHRPDSPKPKRSKVKRHAAPRRPFCGIIALTLISLPVAGLYGLYEAVRAVLS